MLSKIYIPGQRSLKIRQTSSPISNTPTFPLPLPVTLPAPLPSAALKYSGFTDAYSTPFPSLLLFLSKKMKFRLTNPISIRVWKYSHLCSIHFICSVSPSTLRKGMKSAIAGGSSCLPSRLSSMWHSRHLRTSLFAGLRLELLRNICFFASLEITRLI